MSPRVPLFLALVGVVSCNDTVTGLEPPSNPATETFAASLGVNIATMTKVPRGSYYVYYADVVVGTGAVDTLTTDSMSVNYSGSLKTGVKFDSGTTVKFVPGGLIIGFQLGMLGMKEGGKRKIVIPSALGYGAETRRDLNTGKIQIPRQSTLVFDVELLKVYNHSDTAAAAPGVSVTRLRAAAAR